MRERPSPIPSSLGRPSEGALSKDDAAQVKRRKAAHGLSQKGLCMSAWLRFLRHYGPVPRNDNMYDETIQRSARRQHIQPIDFEHPTQEEIVKCFMRPTPDPVSVILTGTAGDGKTHLCRQVWMALKGDEKA